MELLQYLLGVETPPEGSTMGLAEVIVWIATRDERCASSVRAFRDRYPPRDACVEAVLWDSIFGHVCEKKLKAAEFELIEAAKISSVIAKGNQRLGKFTPIPEEEWIGAEIIYIDAPDSFISACCDKSISGLLAGFGSEWRNVHFVRSSIKNKWPAYSQDISIVSSPKFGADPVPWCNKLYAILDDGLREAKQSSVTYVVPRHKDLAQLIESEGDFGEVSVSTVRDHVNRWKRRNGIRTPKRDRS